jgi:hypothetical protein
MARASVQIARKDVEGFRNAWLVKIAERYYLLVAGENRKLGEMLVYRSNSRGQVKDWKPVLCKGCTHEEAIKILEKEAIE